MTKHLFRQSALQKFSSPEGFDEILQITSPKHWAALAGVLLLSAGVLIWGYFGNVTTTADGRGVLVRTGGVLSVNASGSGLITEFAIKPGDSIRKNQVIARVSNPLLAAQVRLADAALEESRREADRSAKLRSDTARLRIAAIDGERENLRREIADLEEQSRFAAEQVGQQEKLLSFGLITRRPLVEAQQKVAGIHTEIARRRAQNDRLQAEQFTIEAVPQDVNAAALGRIADLERSLAALREELQQSTLVVSPCEGEALEVKTYLGAAVAAGSALITIQPRERMLEALAYVRSNDAKLVRAGMEAQLSPSTVRREEHGYLRATVMSVSDYPLTPLAIMRRFENESLTAALTGAGPVTEVRLALDADESSGYRWSSSKRPPVTLSGGTLCDVLIVTNRQRPVSLIVPFWKGRLGLS